MCHRRPLMSRALLPLVGLVLMTALASYAQQPLRLYVAPAGNDAWSGRLDAPNAAGTDGPLASLEGARDAIRAMRAAGVLSAPVEVLVRGGTYRLRGSFRLTPEDSGTEAAPITYAAYPGERPVFSGGREIVGWERAEGGLWRAHVSAVEAGAWYFRQLFVNGRRAVRARTPDVGYHQLVGLINPYDRADERNRSAFRFRGGDLSGAWRNPRDIEIVKMFSWSTTRLPVESIDDAQQIVSLRGATGPDPRLIDWAGKRYYAENVFEALDQPGEWYLDRPTGTLYYLPRAGENPARAEIVAPQVERLVEFAGDAEAGEIVAWITLRGLTFEHASWPMPETGWNERQAQATMETAAIYARGTENCTLEDVEVRHVGAHGVWFERGCRYNRLERCHVWDVGAGGIYLGATTELPESSHNVVHNCYVHHLTEVHGGAIGVWIGQSSFNELTRCEIADTNYTGISVGWFWHYGPSKAHDNLIADNYVHHCGHRVLSDMGGIYTLGESQGTVIRHNLFHDIWCYPAYSHASGIYLDQGSTDLLIEDNIVYRCTDSGFIQHYGRDDIVRNNIFAYSGKYGFSLSKPEEHRSFIFERNIVYQDHPVMAGRRVTENEAVDGNLYWCTTGEAPTFCGMSLEEWRAAGHDANSIVDDPGFRDPANGDFALPDDSPALRIGFVPISTEGIGLYGDAAWVGLPARFEHQPDDPLPPEPEPLVVREDFETIPGTTEPAPLGGHPLGATVSTEERPELVAITDEVAATGTRSLRIEDVADLEKSYNPHLYYRPGYTTGTIRCAFDLRIDAATVFYHEWRSAGGQYQVGPTLSVADATLRVEGIEPLPLPTEAWIHFEVVAALGDAAGRWTLAVTLPDGVTHRYEDLAVRSPGWRELSWVGFVSNGTQPAVWYLDNIELAPVK